MTMHVGTRSAEVLADLKDHPGTTAGEIAARVRNDPGNTRKILRQWVVAGNVDFDVAEDRSHHYWLVTMPDTSPIARVRRALEQRPQTTRELAADLKCSERTVRSALATLRTQGALTGRPGGFIYSIAAAPPRIREGHSDQWAASIAGPRPRDTSTRPPHPAHTRPPGVDPCRPRTLTRTSRSPSAARRPRHPRPPPSPSRRCSSAR